MGKADRHINKWQNQNSQLNPFKNRRNYGFSEMVEHSKNEIKFTNKILNKKRK